MSDQAKADATEDAIRNKGSNNGKVDLKSDEAKKRGWSNLKPIQPGETRNPGGRPAMPADVRAVLEGGSLAAVQAQVALLSSPDQRLVFLASQAILDRLYGKASQQVDKSVTVTTVQQQHLNILMDLQTRRDQAMKTIEGEAGGTQRVEEYDPVIAEDKAYTKDNS